MYLFSKILVLNGSRTENPEKYREAAKEEAGKLGESFLRVFQEQDKQYDEILVEVTKHIVEIRRKRIIYVKSLPI